MNSLRKVFFTFLSGALVFGRGPVMATDIPLTPIGELARRADIVVRGSVVSLEALRDGEGSPYSKIELCVSETWKGTGTNRLGVVQGSTTLGQRRVQVVGEPEFHLGEELVLFAVINPSGEAVTLDLARGKFSLKPSNQGSETVAVSDGARTKGRLALPGQAPMPLEELRKCVKQSVR